MKKQNVIYVALLATLLLNIGGFVFSAFREVLQPQQGTSRITNILDEHGDLLKSIAAQNVTSVNGAVTVLVDTLQSPVQFENYSGHIRWNITSSHLEYSDDDSATWLDIITDTDVTYENLSTNSDVGTASNQVARGDHLHDDQYYTESEIDTQINLIEGDIDTLADQFDPDIGHEHTGTEDDGRKITHSNLSSLTSDDHTQYLLADGSRGLSADWNASHKITAAIFESTTSVGTAPLIVTSTTVVPNLNVDQVDGKDETDFLLTDGSRELTSDWDAGSHEIMAETFESDVTTGTAPLIVASTTAVSNFNADLLDNQEGTYYTNYSSLTNRPADDNFHLTLIEETSADDADEVVIYDNVSSLYRRQTRANFLTNRLQVIAEDTTLYIATTGNDTTGDGSSGTPWLTPQKALSYLADYWIPDDVTVTIQLADGTYALAAQIDIEHPCGARISIVGENTHAKSLTSIQSSSGSAGDYSIVLNLDSVADIAVNDYVLIKNAANGTTPTYVMGCHKITDVDSGNTRITVNSKHLTGVPSGAVTADITVIKTILSFASTDGIIADKGNTLGNLNKVVLVGPGSTKYGIYTMAGGIIYCGSSVGVTTWAYGFFSSFSGHIHADSTIASGNTYGFYSSLSGSLSVSSVIATGNTVGLLSSYSAGNIYASSAIATGNTTGFKAQRYGYIYAVNRVVTGNGTDFSPLENTQGNEFGYIDT